MWTPPSSPELFLLDMNLPKVDTSVFYTVDTFSGPAYSGQPLQRVQSLFTAFFRLDSCACKCALSRLVCDLRCNKKQPERIDQAGREKGRKKELNTRSLSTHEATQIDT